jgi:hypothetical protein
MFSCRYIPTQRPPPHVSTLPYELEVGERRGKKCFSQHDNSPQFPVYECLRTDSMETTGQGSGQHVTDSAPHSTPNRTNP